MGFDFSRLVPSIPFILEGIWFTLTVVVGGAALGLLIGMILSFMRISKNRVLDGIAAGYTSIFRGTPLIVQLVLLYYVLIDLTGIDLGLYWSTILALGLNSGAYMAEIIRAGILAVDKGQSEAAMALGVPYSKIMGKIIMPQALKNILPAIINELTALTKESAIVNIIGAQDIMRRSMLVGMRNFRFIEPMLLAAAIYYVLVMIISSIGKLVERRLAKSDQS
ncbi:MAG: amino acid ABC transporter permease [Turicibacter sp.]|nr:amino acid ABC transporter permease [Turicibacter sp.]